MKVDIRKVGECKNISAVMYAEGILVVQQTALDKDLELFDAGDMTEVGEKGITLSGGQKVYILSCIPPIDI